MRVKALSCVPPAFLSFALLGCQVIAGVQDKQLDPALAAADAGPDVVADAPFEAAPDAEPDGAQDVVVDVSDASSEASPLYPARPPARPDEGDADASDGDSGTGRVLTFAAERFFFGSIDPVSGIRTFDAWREFGFAIDGFCTTSTQSQMDTSGVCRKPQNAFVLSQEDGAACRDNTVGHVLAEIMQFSVTDFERTVHARTRSGDAQTMIIQLLDVGDGPDDPHVPARIYVTAPTEFPPLWDGTDVLPVDEKSVLGSLDQPKYVLEDGYIRDHVWVSGDFNVSPMTLPVMLFDQVTEVPMDTGTLTIRLDDANAVATDAMFGGVLDAALLVPVLERGVLEATSCNQSLADMAVNGYFLTSRDLVADAPGFADPNAVCDRHSFGVLFELVPVQPPVDVVVVEPQPSACN